MTRQKTTTKYHNKELEDEIKIDLVKLKHNTNLCKRLITNIKNELKTINTSRISSLSIKKKKLEDIIKSRSTLEKLDNTRISKSQIKSYNKLVNELDKAIENYSRTLNNKYNSLINEREENIKKMKQDDFNKRKELVLNTNSKNTVEHEILKVESDIRRKKNIGKYREELIELQEYLERLNILYNALEC